MTGILILSFIVSVCNTNVLHAESSDFDVWKKQFEMEISVVKSQISLLQNDVLKLKQENRDLKVSNLKLHEKLEEVQTKATHNLKDCKSEMTPVNRMVPSSFLTKGILMNGKTSNRSTNMKSDGMDTTLETEDNEQTLTTKDVEARGKANRLIADPSLTQVVAFYAYLSNSNGGSLAKHHILQYDVVKTNVGGGYTQADGVFQVPKAGTYVFTWVVTASYESYVYTELMANGVSVGATIADALRVHGVLDVTTGTVVVTVNFGDHVFVRAREATGGNGVLSYDGSKTSFSGWLLS